MMSLFILQGQNLPEIPPSNVEYYEKSGQLMMKMSEKENVNFRVFFLCLFLV